MGAVTQLYGDEYEKIKKNNYDHGCSNFAVFVWQFTGTDNLHRNSYGSQRPDRQSRYYGTGNRQCQCNGDRTERTDRNSERHRPGHWQCKCNRNRAQRRESNQKSHPSVKSLSFVQTYRRNYYQTKQAGGSGEKVLF